MSSANSNFVGIPIGDKGYRSCSRVVRSFAMIGVIAVLGAAVAGCCADRSCVRPTGGSFSQSGEAALRLFDSCESYRPGPKGLPIYSSNRAAIGVLGRVAGLPMVVWPKVVGAFPGSSTLSAAYRRVWCWEALRASADISGDNKYHPDCVLFMHRMRCRGHAPLLVVLSLKRAGRHRSTFGVRMLRMGSGHSATIRCYASNVILQTFPARWHCKWTSFYGGMIHSRMNGEAGGRFSVRFESESGGKVNVGTIDGRLEPSQWQFPRLAFRVKFGRKVVRQGAACGDMIGPRLKSQPEVICGEGQWSLVTRCVPAMGAAAGVSASLRAQWMRHLIPCLTYSPPPHWLVYRRSSIGWANPGDGWFGWYDRNEFSRFPRRPIWPQEGIARVVSVWQEWAEWEHVHAYARPSAILFLHGLYPLPGKPGAGHPMLVVVSIYSIGHRGLVLHVRIMDPRVHEYGAVWSSRHVTVRLHIPGSKRGDLRIWAGHVLANSRSRFRIRIAADQKRYALVGTLSSGGRNASAGADMALDLVESGKVLQSFNIKYRR